MIDWTLEPIFSSYWIAILVACALLIGWFFIREDRELTRGKRWLLGFLRFLILLAVLLGIFRPGATFTKQSPPRGAVALMVDLSQSMELSASVGKKSRWQVELEIWNKLLKAQPELGKDAPLVIYGYDERLKTIQGDGNNQVAIEPLGPATDIGKTLSELIATQVEPPLNAIVWMGDATQTVLPSSIDPQQIARQLTQLDIPLLMFGLGPRGDVDRIKDLALEGVPEQVTVFTSTKTQVVGMVQAKGMKNQEVPVRLFMKVPGQESKRVAEEILRPDQLDQTLPFRLAFTSPAEPGAYELEVQIPVAPDELSQENNRALCFLNVSKGGARVLYIEGEPRLEQKFLRRSLESSKEFDVQFQWVQKQEWPKDLTPLLKSSEYDAYILGDLDASALTPATLKMLSDRVREGAGFITLGGYQAYGPGGYAETPLADLLPIEMDSRFRQRPGTPISPQAHYPLESPIALRPMGDLGGAKGIGSLTEIDNLRSWMSLAPMQGANRWTGIKNGPGVQVVIEGTKKEPMVVAGGAELGRVLSFAFDTTHQWWSQGKGELHKRFWRQALLWVIRRESPEEGIELEMQHRRLYRNQSSDIRIRWNPGTTQNPIPADTQAKLFQGDKEIGPIPLSRENDRLMNAKVASPQLPGRYEIRATSIASDGKKLESKLPFLVLDQSVESLNPTPDWALMSQMAQLNEPAGGCLLAPEEFDQAIAKLVERRKTATIKLVESYRLGDGTADSWLLFATIVGLMSIQWRLRKNWSLA